MFRFVVLIPFLLIAVPASANPIADVICDTTLRMEKRLEETLRAERTASGMRSGAQIMEVWTDPEGDWALVMRYATGTSCIVAMGAHWEQNGPSS